jgi:hypothetical protein
MSSQQHAELALCVGLPRIMPLVSARPWLHLFRHDFVALANAAQVAANARLRKAKSQSEPEGSVTKLHDDTYSVQPNSVFDLPVEVMRNVFSRLDAEALSAAAQVCTRWLEHAYEPRHWRRLALRAYPLESEKALEYRLWSYLTWRRLVIFRPRLRTAGVYVQRHQYAKSRTADIVRPDEDVAPSVFLVQYFRLLRFFPDGTVLSLTTPEQPDKVLRRLRRDWAPAPHELRKAHPSRGKYVFHEATCTAELTLQTAQEVLYPRMRTGTQHISLSLTSTHGGAHNRLHVTSNFAVMDDGELCSYPATSSAGIGTAFRYVPARSGLPLSSFRSRVNLHFPPEATPDGRMIGWRSKLSADTGGGSRI